MTLRRRSCSAVVLLLLIGPAVGLTVVAWSLGQGIGPAMAAQAQYQAAPACPSTQVSANCYSLQPARILSVHRSSYKCAETDKLTLLVAGTERQVDVPFNSLLCEAGIAWPAQTEVKLYRGDITAVFDGIGEYRETTTSPAEIIYHFTPQIVSVLFLGVFVVTLGFYWLGDWSFMKLVIGDLVGRPRSTDSTGNVTSR